MCLWLSRFALGRRVKPRDTQSISRCQWRHGMAWHEPDNKNKNDKDPWHGKNDNPPDLDEAFKLLQKKVKKALGGKSSNSGNGGGDDVSAMSLFGLFFFVLVFFWFLSGIFILGPAEKAVILRFGQYSRTVGPGPHWIPRFIDTRIVKNVDRRSKFSYSANMLTKDESLVSVSLNIQYRINNLKNYLFNVAKPEESLRQATASALRQVVGHTTFDSIITEGREKWGQDVAELLNNIMAPYKTGIEIVDVSPQPAKAPEPVQDAFDDAIKAREDGKRFQEQARAYEAKLLPIANGQAKRIIEQAEGFARRVVLNAQGTVAEFLALLPQYRSSPVVLRQRLYIDSIEKVLSQTSKIVVDGRDGNILYLPLDKMLGHVVASKHGVKMAPFEEPTESSVKSTQPLRRGGGRLSSSGRLRDGREF